MKEAKRVIVHGGMCHRDDFMSVGLLHLVGAIQIYAPVGCDHATTTPVFRRNPTKKELLDPDIIVVDIGGEFNPELNNWDHHQDAENVKDECAFSLLCKNIQVPSKFGFKGTFRDLWWDAPWYKAVSLRDNMGPDGLAKKFGLPFMPHEVTSPIEGHVLNSIRGTDTFDPRWIQLSAELLESKIEQAIEFEEKVKWLHENGKFVEILDENMASLGGCMFIADQEGAFGVNTYISKWGPGKDRVLMTATRDTRGPGWSLYRLDAGKGKVDMARLKDHEAVTFAHHKGFVAVIDPEYTPEDLMAIARETFV